MRESAQLNKKLVFWNKFKVTKCMSYCCQMLLKFPMTYESSLRYLGLASGVLMAEVVRPLIVAAKQYLAATFRDISKSADEIMKLPLVGIEAVFASDELVLHRRMFYMISYSNGPAFIIRNFMRGRT